MFSEQKKKLNIFYSHEFISKLFLKLTKRIIDPIIICVLILKLGPQNRSPEEIAIIMPLLSKYSNLVKILTMNDLEGNTNEVLKQYSKISFFKYFKKHSIIRKPLEKKNWFFLLLSGSITVLSVQFEKCGLTKDEYLTYLIKLKLLKEQSMYEQCIQFNQQITDIDNKFIETMPKVKYDIYLSRAQAELYVYSKRASIESSTISSLSEYIHITYPVKTNGLIDKEPKIQLIIPRYTSIHQINAGEVLGSLTLVDPNSTTYYENDYHSYIAITECDIVFIDSNKHIKDQLFTSIRSKMQKICREEIMPRYYLFQGIERSRIEENYSKLFSYKLAKKGDKIVVQGSINEGIFLLSRGALEISTRRSFDELDGLVMELNKSYEDFKISIMSGPNNDRGSDMNKNNQMIEGANTYNNENFSQILQEKRKIVINQISSREAIGLNEYFDSKTKLNYFTVECISDTADLFFIQRHAFMYIFYKELYVKNAALKLVESKIEFYIESIRRWKKRINKEAGLCQNKFNMQTQKSITYNQYYTMQEYDTEEMKMTPNAMRRNSFKLNTNNFTQVKGMMPDRSNSNNKKPSTRYNTSSQLPKLSNKLLQTTISISPGKSLNSNNSFQVSNKPNERKSFDYSLNNNNRLGNVNAISTRRGNLRESKGNFLK